LVIKMTDSGSGVDPSSIWVTAEKRQLPVSYNSSTGKAVINAKPLGAGRHELVVLASDYQESKNNENATRLLPNTTTLKTSISIAK